jgi:probable HAF family extracellular repeat protein
MNRLSPAFALNLCFVLLFAQAAKAQRYTVTDLGTLGGSLSVGSDINQVGQVTGTSDIACQDCALSHAFLYYNGYLQDLGTLPGGSYSAGLGISGKVRRNRRERRAKVLVTGYSNLEACLFNNCSANHAFLFEHGNMLDLGTLPGGSNSEGFAVNRKGEVTGWADNGNNQHAFLYSHGNMQDLGTLPGGIASFGTGINDGQHNGRENKWWEPKDSEDTAQVTGYSSTADGSEHAFLYSNGVMQDLGTLPGGNSSAGYAINRHGEITGYSAVPGGNFHAILYRNGEMQDLGTLPGTSESSGNGINRFGQVVGDSFSFPEFHAFLYSHGAMQALDSLIPPDSGWVLEFAQAINDRGEITGSGIHNGENHAFLLTPICTEKEDYNGEDDEYDAQEQQ